MVHKALNLLESRLPPFLVRRLVGLPFWLYSLSLAFVLPGDLKLKMKGLRASFILTQDTVDLGSLQQIAGKTTLSSRLILPSR